MGIYNVAIGRTILAIRKELHISQKVFAEEIADISERQLIRIEAGESDMKLSTLLHIIMNLELSTEEVFNQIYRTSEFYSLYNELELLFEQAGTNKERIFEIFKIIHDNYYEKLTTHEKDELDDIYAFCQEHSDEKEVYHHLWENSIDELQNKKHLTIAQLKVLSNYVIMHATPEKQLEVTKLLLKALDKSHEIKRSKKLIYLIIVALEHLIEAKVDIPLEWFKTVYTHIQKNQLYGFLPMYYHHIALYYLQNGNKAQYFISKKKALFLSEIYEEQELQETLNNQFKAVEQLYFDHLD